MPDYTDDDGSATTSIEDYVGEADAFDQDYDENNEESRRLNLVKTISSIQNHNFDEKFDSISREISRQITNKEGDFQLRLDEFNLGKILANFVYFAKKQGIVLRKSGVTFKDLCVSGVDDSVAVVPTVLDLLKGPVYIAQSIITSIRTPHRKIVHNFNGIAKPGEMVLVLGRPGAGCTTFLKALSGTDFDLYKGVEGDIRYDGLPQEEMIRMFKNDLIYNPELD
ncbi:Protein SNQ2, partial [Candida maltosa Xu316]